MKSPKPSGFAMNSISVKFSKNKWGYHRRIILSCTVDFKKSIQLDEKNSIVFRLDENYIEIIQCGSHYKDK